MTREAKAKKIHVVLGPTVNIARSPLCGRGFEFLGGEDPYLAGTLAAAFVETAQANGISACLKHFVGDPSRDRAKHTLTYLCRSETNRRLRNISGIQ